jgi:LmbE family N-acetylglucosaminyl deacetylase
MISGDPDKIFPGVILVATPHMDDEVLALGGTTGKLTRKDSIHFLYATDGSQSPKQVFPRQGSNSSDLPQIRIQEAYRALKILGIDEINLHFLGFTDGKLGNYIQELSHALVQIIKELKVDWLFIPFRFDRHPDHLALNRAARQAMMLQEPGRGAFEYFVYNKYRFLPGGDIRQFIHPHLLIEIDIREQTPLKKEALMCFNSQTAIFYPWQERPILSSRLIDEVSRSPEVFLRVDPDFPGVSVFARFATWIRLVHRLEPKIKQLKDWSVSITSVGTTRDGRKPM